jgi:hypothetical protein
MKLVEHAFAIFLWNCNATNVKIGYSACNAFERKMIIIVSECEFSSLFGEGNAIRKCIIRKSRYHASSLMLGLRTLVY